jgi:conjugative relaxase-like TrwC/TraI family protein
MNKINPIHRLLKSIYLLVHLKYNDYYNENEQVKGEWFGKMVSNFNLNREMPQEEHLKAHDQLFNNINSVTGKIVNPFAVNKYKDKNGKDKSGKAGYDLTININKSVSLACILGGDDRIYDAIHKAKNRTLHFIEDNYLYCRERRGKNSGTDAKTFTGKMLADVYLHEFSRSLDPQFHFHAFIFNFTQRADESYRSIKDYEISSTLNASSRFFENDLANEIKKLGYDIEVTYTDKGEVKSWEIKGFEQELLDKFSVSGNNVKEAEIDFIKKHYREPTYDELNVLKMQVRDRKLPVSSRDKIIKNNFSKLSIQEKEQINQVVSSAQSKNIIEMTEGYKIDIVNRALEYCIKHLFERKSITTITELEVEIRKNFPGITDENILCDRIGNNPDIIFLEDNKITTKTVIEEEIESLKFANYSMNIFNEFNNKYYPFSDRESINNELKGYDYREQRIAAIQILNNRDQIQIFRGKAGTGKTTGLTEVDKGLKEANYKVFYFAPSTGAVSAIKKEIKGASAETVASLLLKQKNGKLDKYKDSVIIIDEAGMVSTRAGAKILQIARETNSRVILSGDSSQHVSVERGDWLRLLEEKTSINCSELRKTRRQLGYNEIDRQQLREIVKDFSENRMMLGLSKLNDRGWVIESKNYVDFTANKYMKYCENGKIDNTQVICFTNKEVEMHNKAIRYRLSNAGVIDTNNEIDKKIFVSHNWTEAQKSNINLYQVGHMLFFNSNSNRGKIKKNTAVKIVRVDKNKNTVFLESGTKIFISASSQKYDIGAEKSIKLAVNDKIRITANDRKQGLLNGDIVRVKEINSEYAITSKNQRIDINNWYALNHSYATTSQKYQGSKDKHIIFSSKRSSQTHTYVSGTRHTHTYEIVTPNSEKFYKSIKNSKKRELAHDMSVVDMLQRDKDKKIIEMARKQRQVEIKDKHRRTARTDKKLNTVLQGRQKLARYQKIKTDLKFKKSFNDVEKISEVKQAKTDMATKSSEVNLHNNNSVDPKIKAPIQKSITKKKIDETIEKKNNNLKQNKVQGKSSNIRQKPNRNTTLKF